MNTNGASAAQTLLEINQATQAGQLGNHLRTLDMVAKSQARQRARFDLAEDALTAAQIGKPVDTSAEGDPVDIRLNSPSPITINHNYPVPVAVSTPSPASGALGKALLYAGLLAAGGGAGIGIPWLAGAFSKVAPAATTAMPEATDRTLQFFEPVVTQQPATK